MCTGRILIIDDNPMIHEDIRKILAVSDVSHEELDALAEEILSSAKPKVQKPLSFVIDSAMQGQEGFQKIEQAVEEKNPYMMAFVDVRMPPGWDGIETIARLWQVDPQLQVVICTAYSDHSWQAIVDKVGYNDGLLILKKPFDSIEVQQAAHALCRKWQLHQQVNDRLSDLESLVSMRTKTLAQLNEQLIKEIQVRRQAEEDLKFHATHDFLTHLPNRALLYDHINQYLKNAKRTKHHVACMLLDLDHFKEVNDTFGHHIGDLLLQQVAQRLQSVAREYDTVSRLGGDEFIIAVGDLPSPHLIDQIAERIQKVFSKPCTIENETFIISASIGVSIYPTDCQDVETLIKCADIAMYHAKNNHRGGFCLYGENSKIQALPRAMIKQSLSTALERQELALYYQPLFDLTSGKIEGIEALVRWNHPELGLIEPIRFIPLAEETGLIIPLGEWVLRKACEQYRAWKASGLPSINIAVNLSHRQIKDKNFVKMVLGVLETTEMPPQHLEFEITESSVIRDFEHCRRVFHQLVDQGIRFVIDDFGSGYSSLYRLKELPLHALKIDRFFIQNIVDDKRDASIVYAIIMMAHSMNLKVVAEGVENKAQMECIKNMKCEIPTQMSCDVGQGFFFCKPLPPEELGRMIKAQGFG